jgi:uncharacterized membrane protein YkvA (DUF1232 family)
MPNPINMDKAKEALNGFQEKAEELLKDGSKVEEILKKAEEVIKDVPGVGPVLAKFPLMLNMIRSYISKDYTEVSPKVIVTMVCSLLYLLSGKDLIPDSKPVIGMVDDVAVITAAFMLCSPEQASYAKWREEKGLTEA